MADEAAPKAKNMAELQQCRMEIAADNPVRLPQQTPCHQEKPNKSGFPASHAPRRSRQ
jgi:hypothetical protein